MSTSVRELYVLGRISREPAHGHEIMRTIRVSRADLWLEISEKHVYYILRSLESKGLISGRDETAGARPKRRVFSITPQGKEELARMLQAEDVVASMPYSDFDPLVVMLAYTDVLDDAEKTAVLRRRLVVLGERLRDAQPEGAGASIEARFGGLARVMYEKGRATTLAEVTWLSGLVRQVEDRGWGWLAAPSPAEEESLG